MKESHFEMKIVLGLIQTLGNIVKKESHFLLQTSTKFPLCLGKDIVTSTSQPRPHRVLLEEILDGQLHAGVLLGALVDVHQQLQHLLAHGLVRARQLRQARREESAKLPGGKKGTERV